MDTDKKSVLIINRAAPYGSSAARDGLDVALTTAVFEQPLSLLYMADAVFQLLPNHKPQAIAQKNLSATLAALEMYDIDQLYASQSALAERGIDPALLLLNVTVLDDAQIAQLIADHDLVMSF